MEDRRLVLAWSQTSRWLRVLVFLPAIAGACLTLYAGWPGGISPDMMVTIAEGRDVSFYGHQPPLFSLVWVFALRVVSVPVAVGAFFLAQTLGYWTTFALVSLGALRRNAVLTAALASVVGFQPPLFSFTLMLESNMQTGVAWGLAVALAFAFPVRRTWLACLPLIGYGFIARSGMVVAVAPVLLACFLLTEPTRSYPATALRAAALTAVMAVASTLVTTLFLGAPSRDAVLGVAQLFDIAAVYQETGEHCVPESLIPRATNARAIMSKFNPALVSPMVWSADPNHFDLPQTRREFDRLRGCWVDTVRRHPREFLRHRLRFARIFLMIGVRWAPAPDPSFEANEKLGLEVRENPVRSLMHRAVDRSLGMMVWKGWCWLVLLGLSSAVIWVLKGQDGLPGAAVFAGGLGTLVPHLLVGNASLARYYFPTYVLFTLALLLMWCSCETEGHHMPSTPDRSSSSFDVPIPVT